MDKKILENLENAIEYADKRRSMFIKNDCTTCKISDIEYILKKIEHYETTIQELIECVEHDLRNDIDTEKLCYDILSILKYLLEEQKCEI